MVGYAPCVCASGTAGSSGAADRTSTRPSWSRRCGPLGTTSSCCVRSDIRSARASSTPSARWTPTRSAHSEELGAHIAGGGTGHPAPPADRPGAADVHPRRLRGVRGGEAVRRPHRGRARELPRRRSGRDPASGCRVARLRDGAHRPRGSGRSHRAARLRSRPLRDEGARQRPGLRDRSAGSLCAARTRGTGGSARRDRTLARRTGARPRPSRRAIGGRTARDRSGRGHDPLATRGHGRAPCREVATLLAGDPDTERGVSGSVDDSLRAAIDARDTGAIEAVGSSYDQFVPTAGRRAGCSDSQDTMDRSSARSAS